MEKSLQPHHQTSADLRKVAVQGQQLGLYAADCTRLENVAQQLTIHAWAGAGIGLCLGSLLTFKVYAARKMLGTTFGFLKRPR